MNAKDLSKQIIKQPIENGVQIHPVSTAETIIRMTLAESFTQVSSVSM